MKVKPFGLHKTEGANNHVKQADAFFFARNPIGLTASFGMLKIGEERLSDSKLARGVGTNGVAARELSLCWPPRIAV